MTTTPHEIRSGNAALAAAIAHDLEEAVAARGSASIAVSGGRSPIPLFAALATKAIAWDKITVALVDERWVAPDHADSNEALVRSRLLIGEAAAARFVGMKNDAPDPWSGQPAVEAAYAALPMPFDIVILGMGEDGHTASLFPGADQLGEGLSTAALTLAVHPPVAPHDRMSLSLSAILAARRIILPLAGEAKMAVYREALGPGPVEALPIRAILRAQAALDVWIED